MTRRADKHQLYLTFKLNLYEQERKAHSVGGRRKGGAVGSWPAGHNMFCRLVCRMPGLVGVVRRACAVVRAVGDRVGL